MDISSTLSPSFDTSKAYKLVYQALDYRSLRQDLIASNIANIDTPYYRPKDVDFESMLAEKEREVFDGDKGQQTLKLAETSGRHLPGNTASLDKASIFFRDGHLARNDGNSVDLDVETTELSKNSMMYQALTTALKMHKGIFAYALDSSKNL
ncbi:flagellar basal body rod protein FlgB [Helicobacter sp. 11S02629-2]|uniref:flagellar basal body rod protein FlgB n=1 Tax=Helicobacter sp. 11S02629-2 TaxID=1476195 RepID=UPI000BA552C8|nr:flagellar basal body rod protein FlgB [Helicobacter sp. 11S02629-2]PAF45305.1 flagellar basal body rod protein FlgB [Helicobacter sp. 11S02629-2]